MKIGIILTGYNMEEYVARCISAWKEAKETKMGGDEFVICAVSVPFAGFPIDEKDGTVTRLNQLRQAGVIDRLITEPENIPETTARGMALQWLKGAGCELFWQVDLDEFYTINEIARILAWVEGNAFTTWFRLSLKNYVFDEYTYLVEPFQPPRIHRLDVMGYKAHSFSADNDIQYGGKITRDILPQDRFASMTIPQGVAWVRHMTWQNNDRSRQKTEYQQLRWGLCSFKWDLVKGLVFDESYYLRRGISIPKLSSDLSTHGDTFVPVLDHVI